MIDFLECFFPLSVMSISKSLGGTPKSVSRL
jgi:hypothetical protein